MTNQPIRFTTSFFEFTIGETLETLLQRRTGICRRSGQRKVCRPGDQIHVPANMKYRFLGNISILQTTTAIMSLYLAFVAATN